MVAEVISSLFTYSVYCGVPRHVCWSKGNETLYVREEWVKLMQL